MADDSMPLAEVFRRLIRTHGPISLAHYMAESNARYYAAKDPLGTDGDFVTAPEISQMFGELIGLWLADLWIRAGREEPVHYVELGPGRGTLAKDALRTMKRYGLVPAVHFVEGSPALKKVQLEAVPHAHFHDDLTTVPMTGPVLVVGNEFLDALPVRQLVRAAEGWRERSVGLDGDKLVYVAGSVPMDAAVPAEWSGARQGAIIETSPASAAIVYEIAGRLAAQGGCALLIDYGHADMRGGSTLQAVARHRKVDPLAMPGAADLTAHVDFATLARVAASRGAQWMGTVTQGHWLRALGIETRAEALCVRAPHLRGEVLASRDRLIAGDQMGTLFKVMGLAAPGWPRGAGFDET
ncbi:SAM-dependent methyltransferase [Altererythrobacter sp. TH136]|uniref:class I SAM-dependent methyltransferase n=1 Tax=Altererythrobacter sp. TH136 TaxID=2067415 RepID=UPI0011645532|nr:SAM-dependent methyltransferase [Altererythrobacter sp. TH136]QDM40855.1 class I SAM-dependent methyltransferase [Altererythrobacter sp. TH136]